MLTAMEGPKLEDTESSCAVIRQACTALCSRHETERQNFNYVVQEWIVLKNPQKISQYV